MNPIRFRPHHFLCSLGFAGKGYSDTFTDNMNDLVEDRLRAPGGRDLLIEVTLQTDDICAPCPNRRGSECLSEARIRALDDRHAVALALSEGDQLTWGAALARIKSEIPPERLDSLCAGCQWLDHGLCKEALRDLQNGS